MVGERDHSQDRATVPGEAAAVPVHDDLGGLFDLGIEDCQPGVSAVTCASCTDATA